MSLLERLISGDVIPLLRVGKKTFTMIFKRDHWTIGRDRKDCDLILDREGVKPVHLTIRLKNDKFILVNLAEDKDNFPLYNGTIMKSKEEVLNDGDSFTLCGKTFHFKLRSKPELHKLFSAPSSTQSPVPFQSIRNTQSQNSSLEYSDSQSSMPILNEPLTTLPLSLPKETPTSEIELWKHNYNQLLNELESTGSELNSHKVRIKDLEFQLRNKELENQQLREKIKTLESAQQLWTKKSQQTPKKKSAITTEENISKGKAQLEEEAESSGGEPVYIPKNNEVVDDDDEMEEIKEEEESDNEPTLKDSDDDEDCGQSKSKELKRKRDSQSKSSSKSKSKKSNSQSTPKSESTSKSKFKSKVKSEPESPSTPKVISKPKSAPHSDPLPKKVRHTSKPENRFDIAHLPQRDKGERRTPKKTKRFSYDSW